MKFNKSKSIKPISCNQRLFCCLLFAYHIISFFLTLNRRLQLSQKGTLRPLQRSFSHPSHHDERSPLQGAP